MDVTTATMLPRSAACWCFAARADCRVATSPWCHRSLGARQILVTQANWVHSRVSLDQPVIDVSAANDWSIVRVWWPPSGGMGITDYPAYGFIRADRPVTHDQVVAATPRAIRLAANE